METAKSILARWQRMLSDRTLWDAEWQQVADLGMPRKGNITSTNTGPGGQASNKLYDTTLIDCISTLASFHSTGITPAGAQWFAWEAPEDIKSDEADAWYNDASEKARKILTACNFHTMLNESFEDRSGFGVTCMGAMPHPETRITFQTHPVGSFCFEEDAEGNVTTIFLRKPYTIAQLQEMFGEDVLAKNEKLAKSFANFTEKGINADHYVIHAVFPRIQRDATKRDIFNMRYASCWVAEDGREETRMLERSGFEELPYMGSRYLKSSGSKQQYGFAPFQQVKAAVLNVNKTKQILQVVRQRMAVPSILVPDDLIGNIDQRPGGKTVFNSKNKNLPREWLNEGNPQGLIDEIEDDRGAIRKAYHYDTARMFADREKQMTAREVAELAAEKLLPQSTTFTRFTADFQILMDRIFAILFREGCFGALDKIPAAVVRQRKDGSAEVPPPKVIYQSRLALAIRQSETAAADRMVERALQLAPVQSDALDNIDTDAYVRLTGRNDGIAEKILRSEKSMETLRQSRADAQQQQAQLEAVKTASEATRNAGMTFPSAVPSAAA